jgi:hypothetical protein
VDGTPNFGTPVAYGALIQEPSGTPSISMYSYEAEDAILGGTVRINNSDEASGGKVAGHVDTAGSDYILFHVNVEKAGTYQMTVMAANGTGGTVIAQQDVSVNDGANQVIDYKQFGWGRYNPSAITITLNQGLNTIKLTKKTNFAEIDRLILELQQPSGPPVYHTDINGSAGVTIGDLAMVAASYGKQQGDADWDADAVKADINKDNKVDIEDLSIVASEIMQ